MEAVLHLKTCLVLVAKLRLKESKSMLVLPLLDQVFLGKLLNSSELQLPRG